jgi:hypothetical protein
VIPPTQYQRPTANAISTILDSIPRYPFNQSYFLKNKLPDGNPLPPVATALSLLKSRPSAKTTKTISISTSPGIVYKALLQLQLCILYAGMV